LVNINRILGRDQCLNLRVKQANVGRFPLLWSDPSQKQSPSKSGKVSNTGEPAVRGSGADENTEVPCGRTIARAASRRPLPAENRVQSQATLIWLRGGN
jgi:hypothetical protein